MEEKSLGVPVKVINGLHNPCGIAVNQAGEIFVVEKSESCVSVFNQNGEKLRSFGSFGNTDGLFEYPSGVAIDHEGNALVSDSRIQKFTPEGKFIVAVDKETLHIDSFYPENVSVHSNKRILVPQSVPESIPYFITVLNPDLTFRANYGTKDYGSPDGSNDAACDSAGNIYSAMSGGEIQVLTEDGQFLKKFGSKGTGQGQLDFPSGIAIDSNDVVYVSEYRNHRVSLFTTEGVFLKSFGSEGTGEGQLSNPVGIAVDEDGYIYVSDYNNGRIVIFHNPH